MSWNYRVMRHTYVDKMSGEQQSYLAIHEVYYKSKKVNDLTVSAGDVGCSKDPSPVSEESIDDLRATLNRMLEALDKPVIEYVE